MRGEYSFLLAANENNLIKINTMKNNYNSTKVPQRNFVTWLRLMVLLLTFGSLTQSGFAQTTTQVGAGALSTYFYGPVYRSSAGSGFDVSRYAYLYSAAELSTAGIPSGATIVGIEWFKNSTFTITNTGNASFNMYMRNSATGAYPATDTWANLTAGATLVNSRTFNNTAAYPAIPGNFPAVTGWMNFPITPFVYNGQSLEILADWNCIAVTNSPTNGAFNWLHNNNTPNQTLGFSQAAANPLTLQQTTYGGANRPNIRIIWLAGAADDLGLQTPANPFGATICNGSSTTVDLTLRNNGTNLVDFSIDPATINCSVTGPNGTTFTPIVINSGTLAPSTSQVVTIALGYNASLSGTYNFSASLTWGIDGFAGNNTLNWSASSAFPVTASSNVYSFCDGTSPQLTTIANSDYVATSIAHAPIAPTTPTAGPTGDDAIMPNVPIPFPFTFYGTVYNTLNISTNGYVELGTNSAANVYGSVMPNVALPNKIIALAWEDGNVTTGNIQYFTSGVAPNRQFVIAWNNVFFFSATGNITGQIVLNEIDNSIDVFHTNVTQAGNSSVCGIENAAGTSATVPAGRQFGAWAPDPTTNQGWHFALPTITYSWSPASGLSDPNIANPVATLASGTSQIYTVTVTNSLTGCVTTDTVSLTNLGGSDPAPTTTSAAACAGASATLSASGASTLDWYTAPVGGTLAFTGTTWNNTWTSTTTYYVESNNGTCPSPRTPVTITVTPQPVINPTATPSVLCLGASSQLAANNYVAGNLQTAVLGGNGSAGNAFDISNLNGSSPIRIDSVYMGITGGTLAEVWYRAGGYGCAAVNSNVGWTLAGSVAITPAGASPNLTSIPLFVNVTIPVGQTYGFIVVCNGSNYYTNGSAICTPWAGDANISISQGHGGGGFGGAFAFTFSPRNFNGQVFYSFGDPNLTFNWTQTLGTGSISNSAIANPTATPTSSGLNTYELLAINAANCSTTVAVNVTANPNPDDATGLLWNNSFCGCGVANLSAVLNTVGSDVRWYDAAVGGNLIGTGTPFNAPYACGNQTYYAEAFDPITGCIQTGPRQSVTVTPLVAPAVSVSATDLSLCDGDPASTITASSSNDPNYNYTWSPTSGLTPSTGAVVSALPTVTTIYTVTGTDAGTGCVAEAMITIGVGNTPIISSANATPAVICEGASSQLVVSALNGGGGGPPAPEPSPYCAPVTFTSPGLTGDFISNVVFNTLSNPTGEDADDYEFFPASGSTTTTIVAGSSYSLTVTPDPGFGQALAVFIDFNRDAIFDASEQVMNAPSGTVPVTVTVNVPVSAVNGYARMRVVCVFAGTPGLTYACSPNTFGFGEVEDYSIAISGSAPTPLTYSWSPSGSLNNANISNPIATPAASTTYTITVTDVGGCTATTTVPVTVIVPPAAPIVTNGSVCGQGNANLSALGSGGTILWLDTIGGPILATGNNYSPFVSTTQTYYVVEDQGSVPASVGLSATALGGVAFASSAANYQTFNVISPRGIIINSVDIVPNALTPLGTAIAIQLEDAAGNALGAPVSTVTTTQGTVQTITLNMFVPQGTAYRLRPVSNPNLQYHQNGFTNPYTIPGQVSITGWGPPNATTLYVFFYNWSVNIFDGVSTGCYSSASIATATVNPAPTLVITPSGPTSYCDAGSVVLDAGINSDPSYVNFSWSPATGLDNAAIAAPTASPTVTTSYIVTASDGLGCVDTASITVTVNSGPTVSIDPAPLDSLCSGASFAINATSGSSSFKQIGTGTNTVNNTIAIYDGNNSDVKTQVLYTAAELNAAGLIGPGNITSASFNVVNKLSTTPLTGFTMRMASVATAPPLTATYLTPVFTTVFTGNVSTVLGWNQHVFTTPFFWDGVSNVVLEVCNGTPGIPGFDQVQSTPTATAQTIIANLLGCASLTGAINLNRPNTRFTGGAVTYSWAPAGELSASNIEDPIYTATADGAKSLVLTVTDPSNGCQATATLNFTISGTPQAPLIATASNTAVCNSATVTIVASGTTGSYQWESSPDNSSWSDVVGETNDTLIILVNADVYFRVKATCTNDAFSNSIFFDVTAPALPVGTGATVCGQGNVSLSATVDPGLFDVWYTAPTGGTFLQVGSPLNVFVNTTTTYWVAASVAPIGAPGPPPTGYPASTAQITADEDIDAVTIGSMVNNQAPALCALYTDYTGITPHIAAPGDVVPFSISIGDCENAGFFSSGTSIFVDFNRDGDFADVGEQAYTTLVTTNGIHTLTGNFTVPLTASIGFTRLRIINVEGNPSPPENVVYFYGETEDYLLQIGNTVCQSARVPVTATVTPAPPITISPASATLCEGDSILLSDVSGSVGYTGTYSWTPALTPTGPLGEAYAAPTVTTQYILNGNDGFCQNADTIVITVNPAPVFTLAPSAQSLCNGDTLNASVTVVSPIADTYTLTAVPHAPLTPSPTGSTDWGAGPSGDDLATTVSMPFNFTFFGTSYNSVNIVTNGYIYFGANTGFGPYGSTIPNAAAPNNVIALAWEDLNVISPDSIRYYTEGSAPNRRFVVEWVNVDFYVSGGNVSGQIVLNEGSNAIDIYHTNIDNLGNSTSCGIENGTGTYGLTPAGRNFSVWTPNPVVNEGWRFTPDPAATIQWAGPGIIGSSTGATVQAIPTSSGYYTCTVTNPLTGCTKIDSVAVNFGVSPTPQIVENDTTLCNPDQIYIHVVDVGAFSGGYPAGTTFEWVGITPPIPDLDSISSVNGSSYQVIVTLPSGCSDTSNTINVLTKSVAVVDVITNATCTNGGKINVTVTSGLADYNYVWSTDLAQTNIVRNVTNSSNIDSLDNLAAGTYYLQVYDEAGTPASCNSGILTYVVGATSPIVASVTATNISCNGAGDGVADVLYTGGSAPYSIVWSDGNFANTTPRSVAMGGNYSVIVSDGFGCADTVDFAIVEPLPVTVTFTSTPTTGLNGTVTAIPAGGTGPYTFDWADEFLAPAGSGNPLTGLAAGLYYGLVTDANLCTNTLTLSEDTIRVDSVLDATLKLKLIIEGLHDGFGGMTAALFMNGISVIPTEADSIVVELRDPLSPTTVVQSATVVVNTNDSAMVTFPGSVNGNSYYIAIFHRNAVQTWSDLPVTFGSTTNYDFTTAASQAYLSNQILLSSGMYAFYSGDVNQDEVIDIFDQIDLDNDIFNFASGYLVTDLTGEGSIDVFDQIIMDNNIFNFIGSSHP
jgi:Ig-like domain CHU_C associated/GEVED domain/SprB repeat